MQSKNVGSNGASRVSSIRWSPNGKNIVFDIWTKNESSWPVDIGCISLPEQRFTRLTNDGNSKGPCWSPNGKKIYFAKGLNKIWSITSCGNQESDVYTLGKIEIITANK